MTSALACWLLWLLVLTGPAAQPRRPEILRLATAYELYGGLRRRLGGLDPLRISVTNGARNLKVGTLVGIYAYYSAVYFKKMSAMGRLGKPGAPTFYFGTPLISPKLIELES